MAWKVYYSDPDITAKAGFGRVARLPCIFDDRPGYHRRASRYIIERGLGRWDPIHRGNPPSETPLTDGTIWNYACWLLNFLEWASLRGIDLTTCTYADHVRGRYQEEMLKGIWSRDGDGLGPKTINLRVQQACDYLNWTGDKGYRAPFMVPYEVVPVRVASKTNYGPRIKHVRQRKGKVRQNKRRLRMPTDGEVRSWLDSVYAKFGEALGLMCETILLTAMRLEEVACFRIDTLPPDPEDWLITNPIAPRKDQLVEIEIMYGTKGPCNGYDHGDKIGPARFIKIPLELAERLHVYRKKHRNPALKRWVNAATSTLEKKQRVDEAVHLFLEESTGERIKSKRLYNAWTGVDLPFKGWSPHLGRDWWACSVLWIGLQQHKHLLSLGGNVAQELLESSGMSIIRLQIQPQLGHADDKTTMIYLRWAADMFGTALSIRYANDNEDILEMEQT
ncbi:hypothetical protein ASE07_04965 [Noviherbaspirillum sp. Root189]|nr:hypothetical protein ASE07_04965 [Noviherbaspirillum sp. Root189]